MRVEVEFDSRNKIINDIGIGLAIGLRAAKDGKKWNLSLKFIRNNFDVFLQKLNLKFIYNFKILYESFYL